VAVTETVTLPDQPPAGGQTHRTPLGGDGFRAPMAAYIVDNMLATGDAGGGPIVCQVNMDERFCSLVAYLTVSMTQASQTDIDLRFRVQHRRAEATGISPAQISEVWVPVPVIIPGGGAGGLITAGALNVDTDLFRLSALIYLFNINVRQVMPMGPLLWARGAT